MLFPQVSALRRVLPRPRPIDGAPPVCDFRVTARRDLGEGYGGRVDPYADRAQRLAIANAILASGSDDEATRLAIMERVTSP